MAWLIGRDALFEHLPKTGGKACLDAMRRVALSVREVDAPGHHIGHAREAFLSDRRYRWKFKFGTIRRPDEWWLSLWKFAATPGTKLAEIPTRIDHPFRPLMPWLRTDRTPDEFVGELVNRCPGFASRMFADYLSDADFVFRTDNLGPGLAAALKAAGVRRRNGKPIGRIENALKRVNVSRPKLAHATLSARVMRDVELYEIEGFERFSRVGVYTNDGEQR